MIDKYVEIKVESSPYLRAKKVHAYLQASVTRFVDEVALALSNNPENLINIQIEDCTKELNNLIYGDVIDALMDIVSQGDMGRYAMSDIIDLVNRMKGV